MVSFITLGIGGGVEAGAGAGVQGVRGGERGRGSMILVEVVKGDMMMEEEEVVKGGGAEVLHLLEMAVRKGELGLSNGIESVRKNNDS